ncbi:MAG: outer membrane lipoprotein chaperone LolA [Gammaproteobacteria bacterium]|nr:outer membrane lipoprotein chaperone LolA [Gammaproteobacteria bacterium]
MRNIVLGLALSFACLAAQAADPATTRLESLLADLKSWKAEFQQEVDSGAAKRQKPVSGTFYLQRPGKFRWETTAPYHQQLVSDGKSLWTYDLDLEQVTVQALDTGLGGTPASLLSSADSALSRDFDVALVAGGEPDQEIFELQPKGESGLYSQLMLLFKAGKLAEMAVVNAMGQRTLVRFSATEENAKLDAGLFQFTAPEGVDLIDSRKRR